MELQEFLPCLERVYPWSLKMSRNEPMWSGIALRIFMTTVSHPIEYAKVLIQVSAYLNDVGL
jgi:hypothetical protein